MRIRIGNLTLVSDRVAEVDLSAAVTAAIDLPAGPIPWEGVLVVEGTETGDERFIAEGALTWDELPLPLTVDHDGTIGMVIGRIDRIERSGDEIRGSGVIGGLSEDSDNERVARQVAELIAEGFVRGISVELDDVEGEIVIEMPTDEDGEPLDPDEPQDEIVIPLGGDMLRVTSARIRAASVVQNAAFVEAQIRLVDVEVTEDEPMPDDEAGLRSDKRRKRKKTASQAMLTIPREPMKLRDGSDEFVEAVESALTEPLNADDECDDCPPVHPPAAWFEQPPEGTEPRFIHTDGHRVYGYVAAWEECFAGETEYVTERGIRTLKETVGTTQRVLTSMGGLNSTRRSEREFGGKWVDAEIRSFGVRSLMKVTLGRFGQTKEIFATPAHRWLVTPRGKEGFRHSSREVVLTADLSPGDRLSPLFPKKKVTLGKGIRPSQFGVAHGFTFGDGTRHRDGCRVDLHGEKDATILPYFSKSTTWPVTDAGRMEGTCVANLPAFFKDLPPLGESLSYLYGWLAGYFAADGTVTKNGTPIIFSATKAHLEFYRDVCARLGIGTSEIKTYMRRGARTYEGDVGKVANDSVSPLHRMTLIASTLSAEFFLGDEHRRRFEARANVGDPYTAWRVISVEGTDRVEEVYCAVVPGHENFTLMDNINVMNCHTGYDVCTPPPASPSGYSYYLTGLVETDEGRTVQVGQITMGVGHAPLWEGDWRRVRAHYDGGPDAVQLADVTVGEDDVGIWFSGALRPGVTAEQVRAMQAQAISGDWRPLTDADDALELIALAIVPNPGFPKVSARVADGRTMALVATAGHVDPIESLEARVRALEAFRDETIRSWEADDSDGLASAVERERLRLASLGRGELVNALRDA